ncbi:unnamed protein product [Pedinophyceae sp. YPF-701]|nr:unnamed protein product [Pedinophyceae sp. YPF-701]
MPPRTRGLPEGRRQHRRKRSSTDRAPGAVVSAGFEAGLSASDDEENYKRLRPTRDLQAGADTPQSLALQPGSAPPSTAKVTGAQTPRDATGGGETRAGGTAGAFGTPRGENAFSPAARAAERPGDVAQRDTSAEEPYAVVRMPYSHRTTRPAPESSALPIFRNMDESLVSGTARFQLSTPFAEVLGGRGAGARPARRGDGAAQAAAGAVEALPGEVFFSSQQRSTVPVDGSDGAAEGSRDEPADAERALECSESSLGPEDGL